MKIFGWNVFEPTLLDSVSNRKRPKIYRSLANRWKRNRNAIALSVDSWQQQRARLRAACFAEVNKAYGPEPRHARRGIALTIARRRWHFSRTTSKTV
jgi:hypothetical protein